MKKLVIFTIAALFIFGGLAYAAKPGTLHADPQTAVTKDKRITNSISRLLRDGFSLQLEDDQVVFYQVPPTETHQWGKKVYTLVKSYPELERIDYVIITASVECVMDNGRFSGYKVTRIVTEEYSAL